ncbi:MAG: LysM domain-containing protein [Micropruina sp.]|nr:LysM domain-containing protein [Micropruina sp.]
MFTSNSRYAGAGTYQVVLPGGTVVTVTRAPLPQALPIIGWHQCSNDERLDVIAHRFTRDATQGWLLCDVNDAMVPDALAAHDVIGIPPQRR